MKKILLVYLIFAASWTSAFSQSGTLPVIHIDTDGGVQITSKTEYLAGSYWIEANGFEEAEGFGSEEEPLRLEIRGRGHSSWNGEKKPYKIKLADKKALLGMPKNKHWALLKYFEPNTAGLLLGDAIGMAWTAHQHPVEVVLNGEYNGLYELTETNRIGSNRVDIWEQPEKNEDPATVDGGWLIEIDNYSDPCQIMVNDGGISMRVTYHSPDLLSSLQTNWLKANIQALCDAINDKDKINSTWEDMIDAESIAKYFIVSEIMDNPDAFHGSFWLHRDLGEGSKWVAGPLWDLTCLQREKTAYTFRMKASYSFTPHLIKGLIEDPDFCQAVRSVWTDFYPGKAEKWLEKVTERFNFPEALDSEYERWSYSNPISQQERINTLCTWLEKNMEWFDNNLPVVTSGIESILSDPESDNTMYDLTGRRVSEGYRGFYIKNGKKYFAR